MSAHREQQVIDPYKERRDEEEEAERRDEAAAMPWGSIAGAGAVGVAGQYLPDIITGDQGQLDKSLAGVRRFQTGVVPTNRTTLTDYGSVMGRAAQTRVLGGQHVGDVFTRLRASPTVMKGIGLEGYGAYDRDTKQVLPHKVLGSKKHYQAFQDGPIAAYAHQLGLKGLEVPVSAGLPGSSAGGQQLNYADWMLPKAREFLHQRLSEKHGDINKRLRLNEINTELLPVDQQDQLLEAFQASLSPQELAEKVRVEGGYWPQEVDSSTYSPEGFESFNNQDISPVAGDYVEGIMGPEMRKHTKRYAGILESGNKFRNNILKPIGHGLTGLAALYAGVKMNDYLSARNNERSFEANRKYKPLQGYA
jgi:hypothetical protein